MSIRTRTLAVCMAVIGATAALYAADTYSHSGGGPPGYDCGSPNDWVAGGSGSYTYAHGHYTTPGEGSLMGEQYARSNSADDGHLFDGLVDDWAAIHGRCDD